MYCSKCIKNTVSSQGEICSTCEMQIANANKAKLKVIIRRERRGRIPLITRALFALLVLSVTTIFMLAYFYVHAIRPPHTVHKLGTPIDVRGATTASGFQYSLFINENGELWAWGRNDVGQIGDGTRIDRYSPVHIMDNVSAVAARNGQTMAIKMDGSLWAWGQGVRTRSESVDMNTLLDNYPIHIMDNVVYVSIGGLWVAVIREDGSLWIWHHGVPFGYDDPEHVMNSVTAVSVGDNYAMAIKTDGSLWGWGGVPLAQQGYATRQWHDIPTHIMDNVVAVSSGDRYTMVIRDDGSLWGWGDNVVGQIMPGLGERLLYPTHIMDDVIAVSARSSSTAAILTDGSLWVWGLNFFGDLYYGSSERFLPPTQLIDDVVVVSSGAGLSGIMIVRSDGSLWDRNQNTAIGGGRAGGGFVKNMENVMMR